MQTSFLPFTAMTPHGDMSCKYETRGQIFVSVVTHRFVLKHSSNYSFSVETPFISYNWLDVSTQAVCHCQAVTEIRYNEDGNVLCFNSL
jgi:hypothetical protein